MTARRALEVGAVAATVEQQNDLPILAKRLIDGAVERSADGSAAGAALEFSAEPSLRSAPPTARWSARLTAPRLARLWNSVGRSMVATAGSGRSSTRRGMSIKRKAPAELPAFSPRALLARYQLSSDGVAVPKTSGTPSNSARF